MRGKRSESPLGKDFFMVINYVIYGVFITKNNLLYDLARTCKYTYWFNVDKTSSKITLEIPTKAKMGKNETSHSPESITIVETKELSVDLRQKIIDCNKIEIIFHKIFAHFLS